MVRRESETHNARRPRRSHAPTSLVSISILIGLVCTTACSSPPTPKEKVRSPSRYALRELTALGVPFDSTDLRGEDSAVTHVLVVDGSCPICLYALRGLAENVKARKTTRIVFQPQSLRDPMSPLETAGMECARREGKLKRFVEDRWIRLDSVRKPIGEVSRRLSLDSLEFLECIRSEATTAGVELMAMHATAVGVFYLPALISADSAWVGQKAVAKLLAKR